MVHPNYACDKIHQWQKLVSQCSVWGCLTPPPTSTAIYKGGGGMRSPGLAKKAEKMRKMRQKMR